MFPAFAFNEREILVFALVLIRIVSFVIAWPVFSVFSVPNHAKVLLSLLIAGLLFPIVEKGSLTIAMLSLEIAWLSIKEAFLGLCLGYVCRFFFFATTIGGNVISTSMGLASGQMFNPALGTTSSTFEQFFNILATLFFLAVNGHHLFLSGLVRSFELIPISTTGLDYHVFAESGLFIKEICIMGLQMAAPVMVAVFFMNVAMGIIGRAVPQINVLVTSLPVNVLTGMAVVLMMIPLLMVEMANYMDGLSSYLFRFLKAF